MTTNKQNLEKIDASIDSLLEELELDENGVNFEVLSEELTSMIEELEIDEETPAGEALTEEESTTALAAALEAKEGDEALTEEESALVLETALSAKTASTATAKIVTDGEAAVAAKEAGDTLTEAQEASIVAFEELTALEEVNKVKLDRKSKLKMALGKKAIILAKKAKDPMYIKYSKAIGIKNQMEKLLVKKYASKAKAAVKADLKAKK